MARATWKRHRALQIVQVLINSSAAFAMTMATTPAPPPFNAIAAAASAAAVNAQIPIILARKPPEFHVGGRIKGSTDEVGIAALAGEGVVSRRGMSEIGEEGLRRLNQGGGMPQDLTATIIVQIGERELSREVRRVKLGAAGRRNIHAERG